MNVGFVRGSHYPRWHNGRLSKDSVPVQPGEPVNLLVAGVEVWGTHTAASHKSYVLKAPPQSLLPEQGFL